MGKGEIARYEQFVLFPQCFEKACFPGASKGVIVWEWVNFCQAYLRHDQEIVVTMFLWCMSVWIRPDHNFFMNVWISK